MAIKILIDSASDISSIEAESLGIEMIPLIVGFGEEEYYDGVDMLPSEFYNKLTTSKVFPKTSQITPFRFEEYFERLTANGDKVIAITISSKLSGTYESARQASEKFPGKAFAVDSLSATVGERLLCLYALKLIDSGLSAESIVENLNKAKAKLVVMGVLDTLTYLKKGGRISATVAFIGGMLSIKPVVAIVDGEVKMLGKAMGQKKGGELLNSTVEKKGGINQDMPFGVIWSGNDETIALNYIKDSYSRLGMKNIKDLNSYVIGSTIGTHLGPGVVGIAFFEK